MFKRSKSRTMELIPRDFPALSGNFRYSYAHAYYPQSSYYDNATTPTLKKRAGSTRLSGLAGSTPRLKLSGWVIAMIVIFSVLIYPFLPLIVYHLNPFSGGIGQNQEQRGFTPGEDSIFAEDEDGNTQEEEGSREVQAQRPQGNMLYIPKIGVEVAIIDHPDENYGLDNGAWRFPQTSTPDRGGNTALAAHRFRYTPPHTETFYLLDRLNTGDGFVIVWEGREYHYRVTNSKVVTPTAVEVLEDQGKDMVTLITCDPLFSTKNRLIVTGELVGVI